MLDRCGDIYAEMNRQTIPYAVNLELTAACNLDCIHCYHVRTSGPEMGTSELFRILDELAGLGTMELTLNGGEPLVRPDFPAILRYAVERRGFAVKIFSNLTLLDAPAADLIAALPVRRVACAKSPGEVCAVTAGMFIGSPTCSKNTLGFPIPDCGRITRVVRRG